MARHRSRPGQGVGSPRDQQLPAARRRRAHGRIAWLAVGVVALAGSALSAASLRGSRAAMDEQVRVARQSDYSFFETAADLRRSADRGELVLVTEGRDYDLAGVSFPYALPELLLLIERLAAQYHDGCAERLVVTSLARPKSHQPPNASPRSVHQAGMAMDLRRSRKLKCRRWLEQTLTTLEQRGVLEATYERRPPHYHVAVFPEAYRRYVQAKLQGSQGGRSHRVGRGDTLWGIARLYRTSVGSLRALNAIDGDVLRPGQVLRIPD